MKLCCAILVFFLTINTSSAQILGFGFGAGVKGGWAPSKLVNGDTSGQYIVGPTVEVRLPFGLAAEVDGLYHHNENTIVDANGTPASVPTNYSTWEVPYMAKFRFPIPLVKPFILAGGAYRRFREAYNPSSNGFVTGLGVELRESKLRLSAEGRYLHWGENPPGDPRPYRPNQAEVLFGLTF